MAVIIPLIKGATFATMVRDGVKAAFGFTAKRVLWLSMITLALQVVIAIGFILFIGPDTFINILNGLFTRLGMEPITCETLPAEVCPLLNIGGFQEAYSKACYYAVCFLMVWYIMKRVIFAARNFFILRGFGS